jgi:hypothetical protein
VLLQAVEVPGEVADEVVARTELELGPGLAQVATRRIVRPGASVGRIQLREARSAENTERGKRRSRTRNSAARETSTARWYVRKYAS